MRSWFSMSGLLLILNVAVAGETVLDSCDALTFKALHAKSAVDLVDGKDGMAIQLKFEKDCSGAFVGTRVKGSAEWDSSAGISFKVKGDGSSHLGGVQFIWNDDFAVRYTAAFPIDKTEWTTVTILWRDLVPVLPNANSKPLDPASGNKPSKLTALWFGKWFFWRDYAAHSYSIDDIRLVPTASPVEQPTVAGDPLARVKQKIRDKQPITIVTMGDSLTDYAHWANKKTNWPTILKAALKERGVEATIVNPAIGGTLLRQGLVIMPRWLKEAPAPDLVTICYGGNDFAGGMTGEWFLEAQADAVDRVRRATNGKSDVLIVPTLPGIKTWETIAPLAAASREAGKLRNAGLADVHAAFLKSGAEMPAREALFAVLDGKSEGIHLGAAGHELFAKTVLDELLASPK